MDILIIPVSAMIFAMSVRLFIDNIREMVESVERERRSENPWLTSRRFLEWGTSDLLIGTTVAACLVGLFNLGEDGFGMTWPQAGCLAALVGFGSLSRGMAIAIVRPLTDRVDTGKVADLVLPARIDTAEASAAIFGITGKTPEA